VNEQLSAPAPFSFELFPPRSPAAEESLYETIRVLAAAGPDFISVTYGANGSSRDRSLAVLRHLLERTGVSPLAHLTCVGSSHAEASRLVREFLEAGVTDFLALRGDPPKGLSEGEPFLGDLGSAAELVQLIDRVQAEREQYDIVPSRGSQRAGVLRRPRRRVRIAVAAFPNGHPRDTRQNQDIDSLLAKQTAGATFAITQLFFHAEDYLGFVARARAGGVTMPILPGLMPVTSPARLLRTLELSDERMPRELARDLERAASPEEQFAVGVDHATRLAGEVLAGGAPGLHLYTLNRHRAAMAVLEGVGLIPSPSPAQTPPVQTPPARPENHIEETI